MASCISLLEKSWPSQLESDPPHLINTQLFMGVCVTCKLSVLLLDLLYILYVNFPDVFLTAH